MPGAKKVLEVTDKDGKHLGWGHWCAGCNLHHMYDERWTFNLNMQKPTFRPSMKVTYGQHPNPENTWPICHYFITDGMIEYCADSTHALKGQTLELEDL